MARPKSEDKRQAILDATVRVIVAQGLSAPTATIAREAGIANGTLFTYFETKSALLNALYMALKQEVIAAATRDMPEKGKLRRRLSQAWTNWMGWAVANPQKRRALEQLNVSEEITPETRQAVRAAAAPLDALMEEIRAHGALKKAPMAFVGGLVNALVEATMIAMTSDPEHAERHCETGFETFWRAIG